MQKTVSIFFVLGLIIFESVYSIGQNLVPNPSFETVNTCTVTGSFQTSQAILDWKRINSSDFFNSCFTDSQFSTPNTFLGISNPYNGDGMSGIGMIPSNNYREAIWVKLNTPMVKDSAYCFSFWFKNSKPNGYLYSTDMISITFSSDSLNNMIITNTQPVFEINNPTTNIDGWELFENYYIANGMEQYLSIGFYGNFNYTHNNNPPADLLYYFIDDVSVIQCNKDSLLQVVVELPNIITPNTDGINDFYEIRMKNIEEMTVQVMNRWGNLITEYDGLTSLWDGNNRDGTPVNEGVYFVKIIAITKFGETIMKHQFVQVIR